MYQIIQKVLNAVTKIIKEREIKMPTNEKQKPKKQWNYRGVNIKKDLLDDVDKWIEKHPEAGYANTADMVSEAIRIRIQELREKYAKET